MSYCTFCRNLPDDNLHKIYHDFHYGVRIHSNEALFERLVLEINQAGLSWDLMLKKQDNFKSAFHAYDIKRIANYDENEVERLLTDAGIIRNKLKINAVIHNAGVVLRLIDEFGSFGKWIDAHHPLGLADWLKLFKKTFKFVGGEIVNEFLMSTAYLPGAHDLDCEKNVFGN
jgi:DNA-3-methyladenine glycosylase I